MNHQPMLRLVKDTPRERQWAERVERRCRQRLPKPLWLAAIGWGGVVAALVGAFFATQAHP